MPKQSQTKAKLTESKAKALDEHRNGIISPYEWDFRLVREEELLTVILYEYTRSCPRVRSVIKRWHARRFSFKQFAELDSQWETDPLLSVLRMLEGVTNADAVEIVYSPLTAAVDADTKALFLTHLWFMGPTEEASFLGHSIAATFGSLDKPWGQLRAIHGEAELNARLLSSSPQSGLGIVGDLGPRHTWEHLLNEMPEVPGVAAELLLIDWSLPAKYLVESFRCWVQDRHPGIPPEARRPPGRKPRWEYLKWLATYRLHESGYNHKDAQELVKSRMKTVVLDDAPDVLPVYQDAPAWSKAVTRARTELTGDFTKSVKASFGF